MTTMVTSKFLTNIVDNLGQDIHFDKFTCKLAKYYFFGHFSGGHKNDHGGHSGL